MKGSIMKGILVFIMCLFVSFTGFSQAHDSKGRNEQIESIKVAFITNELQLTSEEAQKFWPIYNAYQAEWMILMRKKKESRIKKNVDPNEKINADLAYESKMLDLKKKYRTIYAKAIPSQKILLLYQAEREFREHLIKQLNHRRKEND